MRGEAAVVAGEPSPEDDSGALHGALRPAILSREAPRTTSPATRVDDQLRPSGVRSAIAPRVPTSPPPPPRRPPTAVAQMCCMRMCMCMCDCMVHVRVCAVEIACMHVVSRHAGTQVGRDASGRVWPCEGMALRLVPSALCVGSRASAALGAMARVAPPYHASTGATSRQARRFSSANIAERPVGVGLGLGLGLGSGLGSGLG